MTTKVLTNPLLIWLVILVSAKLSTPMGSSFYNTRWEHMLSRILVDLMCLSFIGLAALSTLTALRPELRFFRLLTGIVGLAVTLYGFLVLNIAPGRPLTMQQ